MAKVRMMFDGYDRGVRCADEAIGRLLDALAAQGVLDDTVVIISADHGENLGEFNIYGDHQTADHITCRVPLIVRWPGEKPSSRVDHRLLYHFDFAAMMIERLGGAVPANWDGRSAPAGSSRDFAGARGAASAPCGSTTTCASAPSTTATTRFRR
jgi:arylsulfatase A-like enzyme